MSHAEDTHTTNDVGGEVANRNASDDDGQRFVTQEEVDALRRFGEQVQSEIAHTESIKAKWRDELLCIFKQESEEDDRHRELRRQVLIGEAEALANPGFHRWMKERESYGVGGEGSITSWYKEDAFLALSPFVATIPFPRNLSEEGRQEVAEVASEILEDCRQHKEKAVLDMWPIHYNRGLGNEEKTDEEEGAVVSSVVNRNPLTSGKDVIAAIDGSLSHQAALRECPCLFLSAYSGNQTTTECFSASSVFTLITIRGRLLAIEPYDKTATMRLVIDEDKTATSKNAKTVIDLKKTKSIQSLFRFHLEKLTPLLAERSYVAVVRCKKDSAAVSLLNLAAIEARDYECFSWSDLTGLVVVADAKRRAETDRVMREGNDDPEEENKDVSSGINEAALPPSCTMPTMKEYSEETAVRLPLYDVVVASADEGEASPSPAPTTTARKEELPAAPSTKQATNEVSSPKPTLVASSSSSSSNTHMIVGAALTGAVVATAVILSVGFLLQRGGQKR